MMDLFCELSPAFYLSGCSTVYFITRDMYGFRMLPSDFLDTYLMGGEL